MKRIFLLLLSFIMMIGSISVGSTVFAAEASLKNAVNVTVNASDGAAIISWRNPVFDNGEEPEKIVLYDADGEVVSEDFSAESDAVNCYKAEGLENGEIYSYTIEFKSASGETKRIITAVKPEMPAEEAVDMTEENDGYYIKGDSALYNDAAGMCFDTNEVAPEKDVCDIASTASLKFWGNNPGGEAKTYASIKVTQSLYPDCMYLLSFWAKAENGGGIIRFNGIEENDITITDETDEWIKYEKVVKPIVDGDTTEYPDAVVEFIINTDSKGVWIDNIELFECDGNLNPYYEYEYLNTKQNYNNSANNSEHSPEEMMKKAESRFKNAVSISTASFQGMGELTFRWDESFNGSNPIDTVKEIRLYEKSGTSESLKAIIPYGMKFVTIDKLTNGKVYNYRFDVLRGYSKSIKISSSELFELKPEKADLLKYEPENVMINGENAKVTVSWRNPKEADASFKTLRKIELYRIEADESLTLLSNDFSIANKATCAYTDEGLKNAATYSYKLSFVYENARPLDLYLSAETVKATKMLGSGESYWNVSNPMGASEFSVDTTEFYGEESTASLKFTSNATQSSQFMSVSDIPYQDIRFTAGKKYRLEYDSKAINSKAGIFLIGGWDYVHYLTSGSFEWRHFSQDFEIEKNVSGFFFKPSVPSDTIWLDNLAIYELDAKGNKVGSNMIEKFSAENLYADSTPQDITAEVTEDFVKVKWYNTASIDAMKIYVQNENGTFLRAIAPVASEGTNLGGLDYAETTIIAKAVMGGIESESTTETTVNAKAKEYEISSYMLTSENGDVTSIEEAGNYSLKINLKNNFAGNEFTAQLIVAQFNEDGEIIAVNGSNSVNVYETDVNDYSPEIFIADLDVKPETVKVTAYLWNSIDGMDELIESRELK